MGLKTQLRDQFAMVSKQIIQQTVGDVYLYRHEQPDGRAPEYIEIVAYTMENPTITRNHFGSQRTNNKSKILLVPKQENPTGYFPPADGITNGDRLCLKDNQSETFKIISFGQDDIGSHFELTIERAIFKSTLETTT